MGAFEKITVSVRYSRGELSWLSLFHLTDEAEMRLLRVMHGGRDLSELSFD